MLAGVPVVAHGLEDSIVELNWARNEQGGVRWLARHGLGRFRRNYFRRLWWFACYVALVVFEVCTAFSREGRVQLEERSGVEMSRKEVQTRGWA